ncbi:alpha/beta hydrolase [Pseudonocardia sp. H11422]|uniref:alpha/beta hydrolase n=1 Tax=Pseudonocardia sp. H11422 TaxID=2835866 RepID=UPI002931D542|nr:alpha/beta hydrolase [Pseudonocardia sp. H11422]
MSTIPELAPGGGTTAPPSGVTAIVLPGSGSDDRFVRAAFQAPLGALGIPLVAPVPERGGRLVAGYRSALDDALGTALRKPAGTVVVGGISLGAHVAAAWAAERLGEDPGAASALAGLLLALPAWTGPPGDAPAALAARVTAAQVRRGGVAAAVAQARAGAPSWLAAELARAWQGFGAGLADALDAAAAEPGPAPQALRTLDVPAGIAGLRDDPVHPLARARHWQRLLPRAALVVSALDPVGADPAVLGRATLLGWLRARTSPPRISRDGGAGRASRPR